MADQLPSGRTSGSLVKRVGDELRAEISAGRFVVGDKLPSQSDLTERFDVSRTVVREAIASLQADGMVEARQGAGVFITARTPASAFAFQTIDHARISSILETLELRTAVEIEAAGLAATRRSPLQEEEIFRAHQAVAAQIASGEVSTGADFAFHRAIAAATNNPRFGEFLDLLGKAAIPRAAIQADGNEAVRASYLERILDEHKRIAQAISERDEQGARDAMRTHLNGSQQRYRALIQGNLS